MKKAKALWMNRSSGGPAPFTFRPLPTPPDVSALGKTLLDSTTMGSSITQAELGTGIKVGLVPSVGGYLNTLRASQLVGAEGVPGVDQFLFITDNPALYGLVDCTLIATGNVLGQVGAIISDNVTFQRLLALGNIGASSMTGLKWFGKAGGSSFTVRDCILADMQSPNIQFNGDGDAGTYKTVILDFLRCLGAPSDNEAFYCGDTSTVGYGILDTVEITDGVAHDKGWDGYQINSTVHAHMKNCIAYNVGQAVFSGQKSLVQLQNLGAGALIENCLFWGAPQAFQVATRDITFRKCIFYSAEEGFYQDVVVNAGYSSPIQSAAGTITFDQCEFYSSISRSHGFRFQESTANLVCTNNKIGNNITTGLYFDNRVDKSIPIVETGTTVVATPAAPTFNSTDKMNQDHFLVNESYYRTGGFGYRV